MRSILMILFYALTISNIKAQQVEDILKTSEIVWYGLDFSNAKFIGNFGHTKDAVSVENQIKNLLIPDWNAIVIEEPQNFNLNTTLNKGSVFNDIKPVSNSNKNINADSLIDYNQVIIKEGKLTTIVNGYISGEKKEGIALVFIVNYFDKNTQTASVNSVFFDIKTRKILMNQLFTGKPSGIGVKNYWAGAIKEIFKQLAYQFN